MHDGVKTQTVTLFSQDTRAAGTGIVNANAIAQASNLLQANERRTSPAVSPPGTPERRPSSNVVPSLGLMHSANSTSSFAAPPSTQHASNSNSLGLKPQKTGERSNDPWSVGSAARTSSTTAPVAKASINPATQQALLDAQRKQQETQRQLQQAQNALRQAQEDARQAALIDQQNKAAEAQRAAAQQALIQAQETARQAALIQAQTQQALQAAQQAAMAPKPAVLPPPLIPTPAVPSVGFVPVGGTRPTTGITGTPFQPQQAQTGAFGQMGQQNGLGRPGWQGSSKRGKHYFQYQDEAILNAPCSTKPAFRCDLPSPSIDINRHERNPAISTTESAGYGLAEFDGE